MKFACMFIITILVGGSVFGQRADSTMAKPDPKKKVQVVEAACVNVVLKWRVAVATSPLK